MNLEQSVRTELVDLMATWSASADPATADLFAALTRVAPAPLDGLNEIRAVLEQRPDLLDKAMLAEARSLCDPKGGIPDRSAVRRLQKAIAGLLSTRIDERQRELGQEVAKWGAAMDSTQTGRCLELLWEAEAGEGLEALASLETLAPFLEEARKKRLTEFDRASAAAKTSGDATLADLVEKARASSSPAEIAAALAAARRSSQESDRVQDDSNKNDASKRLMELCDRIQQRVDGAAPASDRRLLTLGRSAVESARQALTAETSSAEAIGHRESALQAIGGALDRCGDPQVTLLEQLKAAEGRTPSAAPSEAGVKGAKRIQGLIGRLEKTLGDSAAAIDAGESVESRLLIERAGQLKLAAVPEAMDSVATEIEARIERLKSLVDQARREKQDKGEQLRRKLLERVDELAPLASGKVEDRLSKLTATLESADSDQIEGLERTLSRLAQPVENDLRLKAAHRIKAAGEAGQKLASALEADELPQVADELGRLEEANPTGFFGRPVGRIVIAVVCLAILGGGYFGWRSIRGAPKSYTVELVGAPSGASVTLIKDGSIHDRQTHEGAGGARFSLPDGEYEIYVNDRFTGRTIQVPRDASPIAGVPVPAP